MSYATINPYTGETVATFPEATDAEVANALDRADAAFHEWRKTSFAHRAAVLQKAADLLRRDADEHARILTLEMGKLFAEAKAEVELSAKIFEYYVRNAEKLLAPEKLPVLDPEEGEAVLVHEPLGILLAIEPWNFPYYQIARILAPQLSAGNVLILKHASNVPQAAARFEKLMAEAGLLAGGFTNLYATRDQINTIINDPRVHGVALTGSEAAGAVVAAEAGKALKKSTMELGGADAFVVLKDADLDKTIDWAVFGRHWNGGQVCVSSKRMIVVDEVYDKFMEGYKKGVAKLVAGDPMDPATTLAPLSSQKAADDLKVQIAAAIAHGAKAEEVGPAVPNKGAFVQPTILTGMDGDNPARLWEFFGPVSMIFRARDEVDAIRIATTRPSGWRLGLHQGREARFRRRQPDRYGHGLRQPPDQGRGGSALRRDQALGLRARAPRPRAEGIRQPQADRRGEDRRPFLSPSRHRNSTQAMAGPRNGAGRFMSCARPECGTGCRLFLNFINKQSLVENSPDLLWPARAALPALHTGYAFFREGLSQFRDGGPQKRCRRDPKQAFFPQSRAGEGPPQRRRKTHGHGYVCPVSGRDGIAFQGALRQLHQRHLQGAERRALFRQHHAAHRREDLRMRPLGRERRE